MAKEFKQFDDLYRKYRGVFFSYEDKAALDAIAANTTECFRKGDVIKLYTNAEIRDAVYFALGHENWQKFRVSLKGCDTAMKLARLEWRWNYIETYLGECDNTGRLEKLEGIDITEELWKLEQIRIDNYFGALRRGGQLDAEYRIRK